MTGPIDRLRAADPATRLGAQPDERAESDLRILLAEPQLASATPARRERGRVAPVLVTAAVALAVIALTAAVLAVVHPRTDVGGATGPTPDAAVCHPAEVLPFQCGTYRSTYGGKAITGDAGGPAKDRLSISFTQQDGALLLTARTGGCFGERVLVRSDHERLVRIGKAVYDQNGCFGTGPDLRTWASAFLDGPLDLLSADGPDFGTGDSSVFFEYLGAAPIGARQLPRNDSTCVTQHIRPFTCATYRSIAGRGTLAFLGTSRFQLDFHHVDGQLTAGLSGGCNGLSAALEPDGDTLVAIAGGSTDVLCLGGDRAQHDAAVTAFFRGVLTYRITGDTVRFTKGSSSATFER